MNNSGNLNSLIDLLAEKDKYIEKLPRILFNGSNITDTSSVDKYDINKAYKIRKLERTKIAPLKAHICRDNFFPDSGIYDILGVHIINNVTAYEISAYSKEYIDLVVRFLTEAEDNPLANHKSDFFEKLERIINFINTNANDSNEFMLLLYHADRKYNLSTLYYPLTHLEKAYKTATDITEEALKFFSFSEENIINVVPDKTLALEDTNIFASQNLWEFFQRHINNYYSKLTDAITRYFNLIHKASDLPNEITNAISSIMDTIETTRFYFDLSAELDKVHCHTDYFIKYINQQIAEYKKANPELTIGKKKYITSLEKITALLLSAEEALKISPGKLHSVFFSYILAENIAPLIPKIQAVARLNNIPPISDYKDIFDGVWDDPTIIDNVNNSFFRKQLCIDMSNTNDITLSINPLFLSFETTPYIKSISDNLKKIILCTIDTDRIKTLDTLAEKFYSSI